MRASAVFFASVLALGALTPLACTQNFGIFDPQATSSSTGGSMVTTTSSSMGTGGMGGAECKAGDACSDENECTNDSCDTATGQCTHTPVPDGPDPMGMNLPNDCRAPGCVKGLAQQVPDNSDIPEDGNPCTKGSCDNGVPVTVNVGESTPCGQNLYCDGKGTCVGCTMDDQCTDPGECKYAKCESGQCMSHNSSPGKGCNDGVCNGGGDCVGCLNDMGCTGSKICINSNCTTSCADSKMDGKETDVDCGGLCPKCGLGKMCKDSIDCATGNCSNGKCVAAPTCNDTVKNGSETDVDCGGSCMTKCANAKMCLIDGDCTSSLCVGNVCVAQPTCTDTMMNGAETDVDCGGGTCGPCGNAKKCVANTDCLSLSCMNTACAPTACSNGVKDGSETAIDCGGMCTKCPNTKACAGDADCQSGNCMNNICAP